MLCIRVSGGCTRFLGLLLIAALSATIIFDGFAAAQSATKKKSGGKEKQPSEKAFEQVERSPIFILVKDLI